MWYAFYCLSFSVPVLLLIVYCVPFMQSGTASGTLIRTMTRRLIVAWALCFGRSVIEASWCCPKRCRHRFESRPLLLLLLLLPRQRLHLCERRWLQQHGYLHRLQLRLPFWLWLQLRRPRLLSHHPQHQGLTHLSRATRRACSSTTARSAQSVRVACQCQQRVSV
jgi:hypothetical protein